MSSLSEAQSKVPFKVVAPSFLPEGASPIPAITVDFDSDGNAEVVTLLYPENPARPSNTEAARVRIREYPGPFSVGSIEHESIRIDETDVEFARDPYRKGRAEILAGWNRAGVGFEAEFLRLPVATREGVVTAAIEADARRVIESMLTEGN